MYLPSRMHTGDLLLRLTSSLFAFSFIALFLFLIHEIIWNGMARVSWQFISEAPSSAGREGGIAPMIISTFLLVLLGLLLALPFALCSAIYLAEYTKPQHFTSRILRLAIDMLAAVPSIVMGMFGFAFFVVFLHLGFSILAGALTLAVMILPILIRNIEDALRNIPQVYRLNAAALGLSELRTVIQILLPLARNSIVMAMVLSIGRAMAETAALLFTSGYVMRMPDSIMDSGRSLSVHILDLSINVPGGESSAYASAFVLLILLLIINLVSSTLNRFFSRRALV